MNRHSSNKQSGGALSLDRRVQLIAATIALIAAVGGPITGYLLTHETSASGTPAPKPTFGGSGPAASPASAATSPAASAPLPEPALLGAPDFNGYCEHNGQGSATFVSSYHAYGWRCTRAGAGANIDAACAWTYRLMPGIVISVSGSFYSPSWDCWQVHRQVRPPDWNGFCQAKGWGAVHLIKSDAYGWVCTGNSSALAVGNVCSWTNSQATSIVGRFQNFYDPRSWQCWV
jgi:hypothetical protein